MQDFSNQNSDFMHKVRKAVEEHLSNEKFGVSELAKEMGMSRSNLLRKIRAEENLSVSQFIRQIRLEHSMEILKNSSITVSEVAFQVGFSSPSYFIKCFHEFYGYSPGEVGKRIEKEQEEVKPEVKQRKKLPFWVYAFAGMTLIAVIITILFILIPFDSSEETYDKSIAVLPFKNDSNDSTNLYFVNGLVEAVLNNLQQIEDLRVISRTSVEKYRFTPQVIPEIGKELNVSYFVEGSGQKIGSQILLNIQLIAAQSDEHLWAKQYQREATDIFKLQAEVSKDIANEIEAIITPDEARRIEKIPTDNLEAYDHFMKGMDFMYSGVYQELDSAILQFHQAIQLDPTYARPYSSIAVSYFFKDAYQAEKQYSDSINHYADQALLRDSKSAPSLIAKAVFYLNSQMFPDAVPFLEKALEYNPNSALALNVLSDFYVSYMPDVEKYLHYALKGKQLDIASKDSVEASFVYLHLANAFVQSGFIDEAVDHINQSIQLDPENLYAQYVKAYILYAKDGNIKKAEALLEATYLKDSSRLDILQEVGKIHYYQRDFDKAYVYYIRFIEMTESQNLIMYPSEYGKIAMVLKKVGLEDQSKQYFEAYKAYGEQDNSLYQNLSLGIYYANNGEPKKAIEYFWQFTKEHKYHYWTILFLPIDPLVDEVKNLPDFKDILKELEKQFWAQHDNLDRELRQEGLL